MRGEGGSASAIFTASPLTLALSPEGRGDTAAGGCGSGFPPPAAMTPVGGQEGAQIRDGHPQLIGSSGGEVGPGSEPGMTAGGVGGDGAD